MQLAKFILRQLGNANVVSFFFSFFLSFLNEWIIDSIIIYYIICTRTCWQFINWKPFALPQDEQCYVYYIQNPKLRNRNRNRWWWWCTVKSATWCTASSQVFRLHQLRSYKLCYFSTEKFNFFAALGVYYFFGRKIFFHVHSTWEWIWMTWVFIFSLYAFLNVE